MSVLDGFWLTNFYDVVSCHFLFMRFAGNFRIYLIDANLLKSKLNKAFHDKIAGRQSTQKKGLFHEWM